MSDKSLSPAKRKALYKRQDAAIERELKRIQAEDKARLDEVNALAAACDLRERRERLLAEYAYEMLCILTRWKAGQVTNVLCNRRDQIIEIFL